MSVTFYYADWCPHCQATKPAWKKAKKKLGGVKIVEKEESQMTAEDKSNAQGFPTFYITKSDGTPVEPIVGARTDADALAKEIKNKLGGGGARRRTYRRQRKLRHRTLRNYKSFR